MSKKSLFSPDELENLYTVLVDFCVEHRYPPTIRELCSLTGITSSNSMRKQLRQLALQGLIEYHEEGRARAITLLRYQLVPCDRE